MSSLTDASATYGKVLRCMFQIQDVNIETLSIDSLTYEYSIRPELMIYFCIDSSSSEGSSTGTSLQISRIKWAENMTTPTETGYLSFIFDGTSSRTLAQASKRYVLDASTGQLAEDANWSSDQWLKIDEDGAQLVSTVADATYLVLANAMDLIDFSNPIGDGFNPTANEWQTNEFAAWPVNPSTNEIEVVSIEESSLNEILEGEAKEGVDPLYREQFGTSEDAVAVASSYLDQIEAALADAGESLRYSKDLYLTVRENMLSHTFGAIDEVNAELGESTVPFVYFTNAQDDDGVYHPFMVVGTRNGSGGPNFLIDVARPPGDGSGTYETSTITRNAVLTSGLFRIPLKDYGLTETLLENDMTVLGATGQNSLAEAAGIDESEYDVYNYASYSVCGITVDGVKIYPAYNNTLVFTPMNGEITSTGIHVGQGMGLHYHADGHSLNGNGINLYNIEDYEGHLHPPIIGFGLDGVAIYGKYEEDFSEMDGYNVPLDEYGGHDHDDYGYHYHAYAEEVSNTDNKGNTYDFTQHFLMVGAYRGVINEIPDFQNGGTNQLKDEELEKYVGLEGTYVTTDFEIVDSTVSTFTVTADEVIGGSISGAGTYDEGASITLVATAEDGYEFIGWGGDVSGEDNPLVLTADGDFSVSATFEALDLWDESFYVGDSWYSSEWFGNYYVSDYWIYHLDLGWLYSSPVGMDSTWLYMPDRGWLFTTEEVFPYLYEDEVEDWLYFSLVDDIPSFYEYSSETWVPLTEEEETADDTVADDTTDDTVADDTTYDATDDTVADDTIDDTVADDTTDDTEEETADDTVADDTTDDTEEETTEETEEETTEETEELVEDYGDEIVGTVWEPTGDASVSLSTSVDSNLDVVNLSLTTNLYPGWDISSESEHYVTAPTQLSETINLVLHPDYSLDESNELVVYNPTFSDVAYVGRPNNSLADYTHWDSTTGPKELLAVDMLSVEAYDMSNSHGANSSYTGKLRFNVHYVGDNDLTGVTWSGGFIPLTNDFFYAHTQPTGEYHLHGFKPGMEFDYSNKVIGYALDGYPVMGMNTLIYLPVLSEDDVVSGYDAAAEMKPAISGYSLLDDGELATERGEDLDLSSFPAGIFHVDHVYSQTGATDSYLLDKYNMGFVTLTDQDGVQRVEKAYVQTQGYPYLIHTLYGENTSSVD